jgi:hypothetical protein
MPSPAGIVCTCHKSSRENFEALLQAIANGPISTWRHINLLGEYDCSKEKLQHSIGIKPPKFVD